MSYTKREWATGNVVGAVDLNRIENGIEDSRGILVVNAVYDSENDSYTLDKTWQEIYDAFPFVIEYQNALGMEGKSNIISVGTNSSDYIVETGLSFITNSASGYPTSLSNSGGEIL